MDNDIRQQISKTLTVEQALAEANRCLLCQDAPCQQGCPVKVPVKEFIRNIIFKNFKGAYHLIKSANILGASCARICNAAETCMANCTSDKLSRPIEINKLQQFVCDMFIGDEPRVIPVAKIGKSAAVIGAGPAGLSTAFELYRNGLDVTIFEKESYLGGLLHDGIPAYRLPSELVEKETECLERFDIEFVKGEFPPSVKDLREKYDVCVVATGLPESKILEVRGHDLPEVLTAKNLLKGHKLKSPVKIGKEVVIIGGGNSALDTASMASDLGAKEVTILYRRTEVEMPAWKKEIAVACAMGVSFRYLTDVVEILGTDKVTGVRCQVMKLQGKTDADERRRVTAIENATFDISADTVIFGIGEGPDQDFFKEHGLKIKSGSNKTNIKNVFFAGDLVCQNSSAVHAVASGQECTKVVLEFLNETFEPVTDNDYYIHEHVNLTTSFCGVTFENPFILAAAPPSDDLEMVKNAFRAGWAGAVLKTTSIETNEVPLKYPMMTGIKHLNENMMGLGNIDLISEHHIDVIENNIKELKKEFPNKVVIASIMGEKQEDWESLVKRLEEAGVDMIECSFSCPQGTLGSKPGFMLGQSAPLVKKVATWIKNAAKKVPVIIKITPQVTDIVEIANAVRKSGADGICASNSIPSIMGINLETFVPYPDVGGKSTYSGYTGPAIKPITLRNIAEIRKNVDIPITGTGGPVSWQDAVELMAVGASNVQFCTAVMHYGFDIINDLCSGLTYYMKSNGMKSVEEIIGRSLPFITSHDQLVQSGNIVSEIDEKRCINCGACHIACRDGGHQAIIFNPESREVKTDQEKCVGCGFCLGVCPVEDCLTLKMV